MANAVLTSSRFRDETCFAHFFGEQRLAQYVVDLMRALWLRSSRLRYIFAPPEIFGHFFGIIQTGRPSGIFVEKLG